MVELYDYQKNALIKLRTGSILCGGVGSGKSIVALAYYVMVCGGNYEKPRYLTNPKDLYIITTAKKRNSFEWNNECARFNITSDQNKSISNVKLTIDSWNNIGKYTDITNAFFIFDEQRVVGSGAWVRAFLKITKAGNRWILLSATPGDQWTDYIPVFVANGFYRNRTEFQSRHCIYSRFSKYPKIENFIYTNQLEMYRDKILVPMRDPRTTLRHKINRFVPYDQNKYKIVWRDRWDPYDNEPIEETGKLFYLLRKVVNLDKSRIKECIDIIKDKRKVIIFYNFNYELEELRKMSDMLKIKKAEWNGQCHQELPNGDNWIYLVQYSAGSEGWNCITTDTIIFYSLNYSYKAMEQSMGRIDRINTPYKDLFYYFIRSKSPIDNGIWLTLSRKKNFNERKFLCLN